MAEPLCFRQPFKGLYILQRTLSTLVLVPYWTIKYSRASSRPRRTWTLSETVYVMALRRMMRINEVTGIMLECTDKTEEVDDSSLQETSFVWLPPIEDHLVEGAAKSEDVKSTRIPGYAWPRGINLAESHGYVGYWIHGGAYRMGNGTEKFGAFRIPRFISKYTRIKSGLSVDYRLSGEARHPAQLLDALAGYVYLVKGCDISPERIVIIADCAGTHLTLMLLRYLKDESVFKMPAGILLFSPWVDFAYEAVNGNLDHPNSSSDVLCTSGWFPHQVLPHGADEAMLFTAYFSPNRAPGETFVGYPKTFISLGGAEVFVEEARELADTHFSSTIHHHLSSAKLSNSVMSSDPPAHTPPREVTPLSYVSDSQKTPTTARTLRPLQGSTTQDNRESRSHNRNPNNPINANRNRRETRSRAPSPSASGRKKGKRVTASASGSPILQFASLEGDDNDSIVDDSESEAGSREATPAEMTTEAFERRALGQITREVNEAANDITRNPAFQRHTENIRIGLDESLFPSHTDPAIQSETSSTGAHDPLPTPQRSSLYVQIPTFKEPDHLALWATQLTYAVNRQSDELNELKRLITHSIAQNNVMAGYQGTLASGTDAAINNLKQLIIESNARAGERQTGPSVPVPFKSDTIDMIARKVTAIEQKVKESATVNPPGPGKTSSASKNPVPEKGKGKDKETLKVPSHSPQAPEPAPTDISPTNWYDLVNEGTSDERLILWAAMITIGKWGVPNEQGACEGVPYGNLAKGVGYERRKIQEFISRSAYHHMAPGKSWSFVSPPISFGPFTQNWAHSTDWEVCNHEGDVVTSGREIKYAPGTSYKTHNAVAGRLPDAPHNTPKATSKLPEDKWRNVPKGGGKPKSGTPKKTFADAAKSTTKPTGPKGPQARYNNIPVQRFMAPPPRSTVKRTHSFGKKYMIKFHNEEKPVKGTEMNIQAVVSEVNRTCASQFHIKCVAAEWTPAMNLIIYFTTDSVDTSIVKAKATIMGTLARGCPKSIFIKSVKWSRIGVRGFPTQRWKVDMTDDAEGPQGYMEDVTKDDMEEAIRAAHPLLQDVIFMDGPSWTARDGKPPAGSTTANVSFTIPDPNESAIKTLTRQPLLIFGIPCYFTSWEEKVNIVQCTRCWKYGDKVHPDCPIRCQRCGGNHPVEDHDVECKKCANSELNQEDRKAGRTTCEHPPVCPNCTEAHLAGDDLCRMRDHAACETRRRKKIGQGQAFISSYMKPPAITNMDTATGAGMTFEQQQALDQQTFGPNPTSAIDFSGTEQPSAGPS